MKQLVFNHSEQVAYFFDGKKLEPVGKMLDMANLLDKVVYAIGADIYAKNENGEFKLLLENASFHPRFSKKKGLFILRNGEERKYFICEGKKVRELNAEEKKEYFG